MDAWSLIDGGNLKFAKQQWRGLRRRAVMELLNMDINSDNCVGSPAARHLDVSFL